MRPLALALALVSATLAAFPALLGPVAPGGGALVAQRSILFEELRAEIRVETDGRISVVETLRPRFTGEWNGIVRNVSVRPPENYGARYSLEYELLSATDGAGSPLRHEVNRSDRSTRQFRIWVPNARDRTATVVLTYRVGNALGFFEPAPDGAWDAMDELYWQVTGTDWDVPILRASARIVLPEGAEPVRFAAYVGGRTSTETAAVRVDGGVVEVGPVGRLDPGQGLTVGVGWPAGFVARPPARRSPPARGAPAPPRRTGPLAFWPLLLPFAVFWWAHRAWTRTGRDPDQRAVLVRWEPPDRLSSVAAGTLVDHRAEMHDILSILVDLAVRGYLIIEERERTGFLRSGREYHFHLTRGRETWDDLQRYERLFLDGLFAATAVPARKGLFQVAGSRRHEPKAPFGAIETVRMDDLQNRFYKSLGGIRDAVYDALIHKGHYLERPDRVRARWAGFAVLALAAGAAGLVALGMAGGGSGPAIASGVAMLIAGIASAAILGVFAWIMPARTEKGARTREAALGFKQFLERVESPRYKRMITSPDQFEVFLPYAIAFRCEDRWARAFDGLLTQPPDWYRSSHGFVAFRPSQFSRDLRSMSTAAVSTLSSSPSSSGSGGGGSVGGGGGGGGGGGF